MITMACYLVSKGLPGEALINWEHHAYNNSTAYVVTWHAHTRLAGSDLPDTLFSEMIQVNKKILALTIVQNSKGLLSQSCPRACVERQRSSAGALNIWGGRGCMTICGVLQTNDLQVERDEVDPYLDVCFSTSMYALSQY